MAEKTLIVDDEPFTAEEASEGLTEEGYDWIAGNGVDAAGEVRKNNSDIAVIVTDLKMPGKTGADLINEVQKACERDIEFIIMSGSNEDLGPDLKKFPFLRKPLDISELIESVKMVLG